jgi:hypothetical protein
VGGESTKAFERVLLLFDRGLLPFEILGDWRLVGTPHGTSPQRVDQLLTRIVRLAQGGNGVAAQLGLDMLALREQDNLLQHKDIEDKAWQLLEVTTAGAEVRSHWWDQLLSALGRRDPVRASRIACRVLTGEGLGMREEAARVLATIATDYPAEVMDAVGTAALDDEKGWKFFLGDFRGLLSRIPPEIAQSWVSRTGVEGARRLARHLPIPHLDNGKPMVPPLTEWVLSTFGSDERVFKEFCMGVHSMEIRFGDIAAQYEREANTARAFLEHSNSRIREWAAMELRWSTESAKREREEDAERWLS